MPTLPSNWNWLHTVFFLSRVSLKFLFPLLTTVGTDEGTMLHPRMACLVFTQVSQTWPGGTRSSESEAEHTPQAAQCAYGKTWTQDISLSGQPPSHSGKWNGLLLIKITAAKCARLVLWRKPTAICRVTNPEWVVNKMARISTLNLLCEPLTLVSGQRQAGPSLESRVSHGQCSGCRRCSVLWSVPGQLQMTRERLAWETLLLSCSGSSVHMFPRSQAPHCDEI